MTNIEGMFGGKGDPVGLKGYYDSKEPKNMKYHFTMLQGFYIHVLHFVNMKFTALKFTNRR